MANKIELNKQTLRVLSAEEMEAVAGGADTSGSTTTTTAAMTTTTATDTTTTDTSDVAGTTHTR